MQYWKARKEMQRLSWILNHIFPAKDQHENGFIHRIAFPVPGTLEAIPNGNAVSRKEIL